MIAMNQTKGPVLCFGEVLWDCLPQGLFMGGAPVNVAYHLQQLGAKVLPISAVGDDFLGREIIRRLKRVGLDTRFVPDIADVQTGVVLVELTADGQPSYEIVQDVAWDMIPESADLMQAAADASAIVFGSLAQRSQANKKLLLEMLDTTNGLRAFDVNLRRPFDDLDLVAELAAKADLIKLNNDEAYELAGLPGDAEIEKVAREVGAKYACDRVCVTAGGDGAGMRVGADWYWGDGETVDVVDTIGAGDSFMAALVDGLLRGGGPQAIIRRATRLAGFVAASRGAMPDYADAPDDALKLQV